MELEGVVHNGVIVPDDAKALPEGMRVRITSAPPDTSRSFGERFARFKGAAPGLPADLAEQHDRYRLGPQTATPTSGCWSRRGTKANEERPDIQNMPADP